MNIAKTDLSSNGRFLLSKPLQLIVAIIWLLTFIMPKTGLGFNICPVRIVTDFPCPLCGITRSLTCISHGDFSAAFNYHPLGFLVYLILAGTTLPLLLPPRKMKFLKKWLTSHLKIIKFLSKGLLWTFLGYWLFRVLCLAIN